MDDIDHDKALAALEQLEAEKARRLQAKIDAGDLVLVETTVVVDRDEDNEEATARAIAAHPIPDDGRHSPRTLLRLHRRSRARPGLREREQSPKYSFLGRDCRSPC